MAERMDDIGFGGLKLIQEPEEFCYGVDAVILADFAAKYASGKPKSIVDLGTGTGIIPLILSHKTQADLIAGVELQQASYERACRNAEMNKLQERIHFFHSDVKEAAYGKLAFLKGSADVVTTNPPYMPSLGGLTNAEQRKGDCKA